MMRRLLLLVRLALRGVFREARRSLLTASAMALGLALLIFSRALADGAHEDWIDLGVRLASGHVAVQAPGFLESGSLDQRLEAEQVRRSEEAIRELVAQGMFVHSTTRLAVSGLASSAESAVPAQIVGVDPVDEGPFSEMDAKLVESANENIRSLRRQRAPIEVLGCAAEAADYSGVTAFYLFNPFGRDTMQAWLGRVEASHATVPRDVRIAYASPYWDEVLAARHWLRLEETWPAGRRGFDQSASFWTSDWH